MPVYNCRPFIEESVNSILKQTFIDFELIIIDDCSTDGTYEYLQALSDKRIRLIRKERNSGYTISLNIGLEMALGKYIARMDGDDISLPDRFEKQVIFLEKNPECILVGAGYKIIDSDRYWIPAEREHDKIVVAMLEHSPFAHPTVMLRNRVLEMHQIKYDIGYEPAEDYKLWTRLQNYGRLANMPEAVLLYRYHPNQTSVVRAKRQADITSQIQRELMAELCGDENLKEEDVLVIINDRNDLRAYFENEASLKKCLEKKGNTQTQAFYEARANRMLLKSVQQQQNKFLFCVSLIPSLLKNANKTNLWFFSKLLIKSLLPGGYPKAGRQ